MATMTTNNMRKASNVLGKRCEDTKKNMKAKMKRAGTETYKTVSVIVPRPYDSGDDVLTIGYQGEMFYFLRGQKAEMPEPVAEIGMNCGLL